MGLNPEYEDTKVPAYNPYTQEQSKKIKEMWFIYRNDIGLEGDIYRKLIKEGLSEREIDVIIDGHRAEVKELKKAWEDIVLKHNDNHD